jgi:AcrR family transcriptional regulator
MPKTAAQNDRLAGALQASQQVRAKRKPKQARSQETVERILSAASGIINKDGVEALTTNSIAAAAGMSVASVYQFFPNKLAIVSEIYQRWLADVDSRVMAAIDVHALETDWRVLALAIADELGRFTLPVRSELELMRAMWSHRDLFDMDRRRNQILSQKIASAMARFAEDADMQALQRAAGFASEIFTLVTYLDFDDDANNRTRLTRHAQDAFLVIWASVLKK